MIEAIIYDFHGTLVDVSELLPLLSAGDYDGFYEASLTCPPIGLTAHAARQSHRSGYANLLFTGMPDRYIDGLKKWLDIYDIHVDLVSMRSPEDGYTKDFIVKRKMYLQAVDLGYYVMRAWEDSPAVIELWKRQGIPVEEVPRYPAAPTDRVDRGDAGL